MPKTKTASPKTQLVYHVRGGSKATKGSVKRAPTANQAAPAKLPQSKAEFVSSRQHLSPKEIVEDAMAAGLKLDVGYVYNVRGAAKANGVVEARPTKLAARRSTERTVSPVARPIPTASKAEDILRAVAAEVGLGRAIELLQGERARVREMMRG